VPRGCEGQGLYLPPVPEALDRACLDIEHRSHADRVSSPT